MQNLADVADYSPAADARSAAGRLATVITAAAIPALKRLGKALLTALRIPCRSAIPFAGSLWRKCRFARPPRQ
jgi:hypothetical protein